MTRGAEVEFLLDGRSVRASRGESVLEVARRHGIHIPTLCHHDAIEPYGACRLCVVEATRRGRSRVVTSCEYRASGGEEIRTTGERVLRVRRVVLELLLARAPDAEVVRDLAREAGVDRPRFEGRDGTPFERRCILCGLCVRVCGDGVGRHAIASSPAAGGPCRRLRQWPPRRSRSGRRAPLGFLYRPTGHSSPSTGCARLRRNRRRARESPSTHIRRTVCDRRAPCLNGRVATELHGVGRG